MRRFPECPEGVNRFAWVLSASQRVREDGLMRRAIEAAKRSASAADKAAMAAADAELDEAELARFRRLREKFGRGAKQSAG